MNRLEKESEERDRQMKALEEKIQSLTSKQATESQRPNHELIGKLKKAREVYQQHRHRCEEEKLFLISNVQEIVELDGEIASLHRTLEVKKLEQAREDIKTAESATLLALQNLEQLVRQRTEASFQLLQKQEKMQTMLMKRVKSLERLGEEERSLLTQMQFNFE